MYIYGKNVVIETLKQKKKINKAIVCKDIKDQKIVFELQKRDILINYVSKKELDKLAPGNHQGIIIDVPSYQYASIESLSLENNLIVMLDHLEDPHNFGAIIRSSEAAGVDAIIIPKDRSVEVNATVYKVSVGTIHQMKMIQVTNLVNTIKDLKQKGFWIVGTDMKGTCYSEMNYKGNICIVIGNEGKGMSNLVKKNCDFIASIPMKGKVNSLNASVAAGIIIFEASRQRN